MDLNTRGGIAVHARRMGPAYARMGRERGQDDPWTPGLVAEVTEARRAALPMDRWDERVRWRDRLTLALERCRRGNLVDSNDRPEEHPSLQPPVVRRR